MDETNLTDNLQDYQLSPDPFKSFENWLAKAKEVEESPEAMSLATSSKDGHPSVRMVLYKGIQDGKFALYTNLGSQKAKELRENPKAALVFWWPKLGRQIRVEGHTEEMEAQLAEDYFHSRSRLSQIASLTSQQSRPISSRKELEKRFNQNREKLEGVPSDQIPFPSESWGGHWFVPKKFVFFQYREHRLNDRFLFSATNENAWNIQRLQP